LSGTKNIDRRSSIRKEVRELIKEFFFHAREEEFIPGKTKIPLVVPSYDWEEVYEAIDSLLSTQVTMGEKVKQFESMFAEYIGTSHAIMTSSGSTANLLALSILTNPFLKDRIKPGDEIITPAVTWATTVYPIIDCGAVPVLVDVTLNTFNLNLDEVERAITDKTRAIMPVHLLGNPCEMDRLEKIAREHNLYVIEDACEAHGAEFKGQKVGTFGDLATFSFFFSHHITTIEGGMIVTNNGELAELAKALRVFGWVRDLKDKEKFTKQYQDIDPRFLFINTGFNFRPTEIQGAFGIHQIGKLDKFIELRRENADFWMRNFEEYQDYLLLHTEREDTKHVWFGYPVTVRPDAPFTRKELVDFLEGKSVETRPVMVGNMDEQPAMKILPYRKAGELPNSKLIMRNSFFFGNHHGIGEEKRRAILDYVREFMATVTG